MIDTYLSSFHHIPLWLTFVIAILLGLRHATDPDHLAAVSTLVVTDKVPARGAMRVGLFWGLGHAASCLLFGVPILLFTTQLPGIVYQTAEVVVGALIIYFSVKLMWQIYRGGFHFHGIRQPDPKADTIQGRSLRKSFGIGLVHGLGGSYGAALLLLASFHNPHWAAAGLLVFTLFAAVSMALVTGLFAYVINHHRYMHVMKDCLMWFSAITFGFGVVYLLEALHG